MPKSNRYRQSVLAGIRAESCRDFRDAARLRISRYRPARRLRPLISGGIFHNYAGRVGSGRDAALSVSESLPWGPVERSAALPLRMGIFCCAPRTLRSAGRSRLRTPASTCARSSRVPKFGQCAKKCRARSVGYQVRENGISSPRVWVWVGRGGPRRPWRLPVLRYDVPIPCAARSGFLGRRWEDLDQIPASSKGILLRLTKGYSAITPHILFF